MDKIETSRRTFLAGAGATVMAGAAASAAAAPGRKMRGIYPIAQTPCTADNKLDLNLLASQVKLAGLTIEEYVAFFRA